MRNYSTNIKQTEQHSHLKQLEATTTYGFDKLGPVLGLSQACG